MRCRRASSVSRPRRAEAADSAGRADGGGLLGVDDEEIGVDEVAAGLRRSEMTGRPLTALMQRGNEPWWESGKLPRVLLITTGSWKSDCRMLHEEHADG